MKFSVVIPTYNRPERMPACLGALARLDYPREDFEVIVADDGSDRPLGAIVAPFQQKMSVRLLRLRHRGVSAARNEGAAAARGQFIVFTDDDCQCEPDWLRVLSRYLEETPNAMVGGERRNALPNNPYATAYQMIIDAVYAHYNADTERATFLVGANMAVPAAQYQALGGCDESFPPGGEDRDLCERWLERGYPIRYAPDAVVHHTHHLDLWSFALLYHNYGRGAYLYRRRSAERGAGRRPGWGFYGDLTNLLSPVKRSKGVRGRLSAAVLLCVWQVANATGYAREWCAYHMD